MTREQELLKQWGKPDPIIEKGLAGLIRTWAACVTNLPEWHTVDLDTYLNDLDGRNLISELLAQIPLDDNELKEMLEISDRAFLNLTTQTDSCLWGEHAEEKNNWEPEEHWWYYRIPNQGFS